MKDKEIREPLFDFLDNKYGKNRIFEEKQIGGSRADIIMIIENELIGLEIKSDSDTYERLKTQTKDYDKFCDKNYIVIGRTHAKHVHKYVADTWGIICVYEEDSEIKVEEIREAGQNDMCTMENQIKIMWRPELANIQEKNQLPKYKNKSKLFVQEVLIEKTDNELLKKQMIHELFERDYNTWDQKIKEYRLANGMKTRRKRSRKTTSRKARKAMI